MLHQNYLKDAWNVFDFVTVLGSITDILVTEINVRAPVPTHSTLTSTRLNALYPNNPAVMVMSCGRDSLYSKLCANKLTSHISKDNHMGVVHRA